MATSPGWCRSPSWRRFARASARHPPGCDNPPTTATRRRLAQEGPPIDIIFLVERLESLIADGKRLPLTNNVVVDQSAALDLIDQLRVAVPEEIRAAKRINSEGERILDKAQQEAAETIARAQERAAFLIEERGLADEARRISLEIVREAEADAAQVRRGADDYAASILIGLEGELTKTLQSIRKGVEVLEDRRAALTPEPDDAVADEAEGEFDDADGDEWLDEDEDEAAGESEGIASRGRR